MLFPRALLIALALAAAVAWSQGEDAPAPAGDEAPADPNAPPESDSSPFDYEASEEISEDLSVSFPVDI